jgi:hypothetical protein
MATRTIALTSVGAVTAALALGWGFSMMGSRDTSVDVQEVSDSAWRVEVEEVAPAASGEEAPLAGTEAN